MTKQEDALKHAGGAPVDGHVMPQLLPCPFCGGEAGLMECDDVEVKRWWLFKWVKYPADGAFVTGRLVRPICRKCHVTTCTKFTEDEFAAEFWNSRPAALPAA